MLSVHHTFIYILSALSNAIAPRPERTFDDRTDDDQPPLRPVPEFRGFRPVDRCLVSLVQRSHACDSRLNEFPLRVQGV